MVSLFIPFRIQRRPDHEKQEKTSRHQRHRCAMDGLVLHNGGQYNTPKACAQHVTGWEYYREQKGMRIMQAEKKLTILPVFENLTIWNPCVAEQQTAYAL